MIRLGFPSVLLPGLLAGAVGVAAVSGGEVRQAGDAADRSGGHAVPAPQTGARPFEEVRRFAAPEARQGVAVDESHFYAFSNFHIGKYDRQSGRLLTEWRGEKGGPIVHLNSCLVVGMDLVCAHSNFPATPMSSSIEVWDTRTLQHTRSHSFGIYEGSLTWAIRRDGDWWLHFAHYEVTGGTPGKGPEWSSLVRFAEDWSRRAGYVYPPALVARLAPHSLSGGGWGADGRLYVTGHDAPEIYVLTLPAMGSTLEWQETIAAPIEGQAWTFDPSDPETLWGIRRSSGEVVVATRRR